MIILARFANDGVAHENWLKIERTRLGNSYIKQDTGPSHIPQFCRLCKLEREGEMDRARSERSPHPCRLSHICEAFDAPLFRYNLRFNLSVVPWSQVMRTNLHSVNGTEGSQSKSKLPMIGHRTGGPGSF